MAHHASHCFHLYFKSPLLHAPFTDMHAFAPQKGLKEKKFHVNLQGFFHEMTMNVILVLILSI